MNIYTPQQQSKCLRIEELQKQISMYLQYLQYEELTEDFKKFQEFVDLILDQPSLFNAERFQIIVNVILHLQIPAYMVSKKILSQPWFLQIFQQNIYNNNNHFNTIYDNALEPHLKPEEVFKIADLTFQIISYFKVKFEKIIDKNPQWDEWNQDIEHLFLVLLQNYEAIKEHEFTIEQAKTHKDFDNMYIKFTIEIHDIDQHFVKKGKYVEAYQMYKQLATKIQKTQTFHNLGDLEKEILQILYQQIIINQNNLESFDIVIQYVKKTELELCEQRKQKSMLRQSSIFLKQNSINSQQSFHSFDNQDNQLKFDNPYSEANQQKQKENYSNVIQNSTFTLDSILKKQEQNQKQQQQTFQQQFQEQQLYQQQQQQQKKKQEEQLILTNKKQESPLEMIPQNTKERTQLAQYQLDKIYHDNTQQQERACCKPFIYAQESLYDDEDLYIEFKDYNFPFQKGALDPVFILKKTICGFLNAKGGAILLGIDNNTNQANGVFLTHEQQDDFKLYIYDNIVKNNFDPQIDLTSDEVKVEFIPLKERKNNKWVKGKWIPKIVVQQGRYLDELYTFIDFKDKYHQRSFVKLDGEVQEYTVQQQKEMIKLRAQNPVQQILQHKCKYKPDKEGIKGCKQFQKINDIQKLSQNNNNQGVRQRKRSGDYYNQQQNQHQKPQQNQQQQKQQQQKIQVVESIYVQDQNQRVPQQQKQINVQNNEPFNHEYIPLIFKLNNGNNITFLKMTYENISNLKLWFKQKNVAIQDNQYVIEKDNLQIKFQDVKSLNQYLIEKFNKVYPALLKKQKAFGFKKIVNGYQVYEQADKFQNCLYIQNFIPLEEQSKVKLIDTVQKILDKSIKNLGNQNKQVKPSIQMIEQTLIIHIQNNLEYLKQLIQIMQNNKDQLQKIYGVNRHLNITLDVKYYALKGTLISNSQKLIDGLEELLPYEQFTLKRKQDKSLGIEFQCITDGLYAYKVLQNSFNLKEHFKNNTLYINAIKAKLN